VAGLPTASNFHQHGEGIYVWENVLEDSAALSYGVHDVDNRNVSGNPRCDEAREISGECATGCMTEDTTGP
jgi:hypothetical protein